MDFSKILENGKKRFETKSNKGKWGRCDYCDQRQLLFPYKDSKKEAWSLCDDCINIFVEEDG